MGLLDLLLNLNRRTTTGLINSDAVQGMPAQAVRLAGRAKAAPGELAQLFDPKFQQGLLDSAKTKQMPSNQDMAGMAMDYLQTTNPIGGLIAQTVYHGSPHKFNKFDMSKIGTGEGAQAYGHGLYMAEAPEVAAGYQKRLSGFDSSDTLAANLASNLGGVDKAIAHIEDGMKAQPDYFNKSSYKTALQALKNNQVQPGGNLYKVDIPDESIPRMLDWDKPLSEQSNFIKNLFSKEFPGRKQKAWTGHNIYESLARTKAFDYSASGSSATDEVVSNYLKQQGIPGIRYLDGNSRGVGGTSNYVLFDDQLPRILEVNGQPTGLLSWADEAAKKVKKK